jgi:hypothetical protein
VARDFVNFVPVPSSATRTTGTNVKIIFICFGQFSWKGGSYDSTKARPRIIESVVLLHVPTSTGTISRGILAGKETNIEGVASENTTGG